MRISFIGNILPHTTILKGCETDNGYDFSALYEYVSPLLYKSDYVVANTEFAIKLTDDISLEGDRITVITKPNDAKYAYITISAPKEFVKHTIKALRINQVIVANNHSLDNGLECFNLANDFYKSLSCDINGIKDKSFVIKEICGKKICFYSFAKIFKIETEDEKPLPYNPRKIIETAINYEEISRIRKEVDYFFVIPHWGPEYRLSNYAQDALISEFKELGVDRVIDMHPHVVSKLCTGNFLSGRSQSKTKMGKIHHIDIEDGVITDTYNYVWTVAPDIIGKSASVVPIDIIGKEVKLPYSELKKIEKIYKEFVDEDFDIFSEH